MATRRCTRSRKTTGATSTRSARAPATTRASAAPRRCSSTTTASTRWRSGWCGSSTPTGRGCTPNEPITLYGDGSQTRAFCYVDDLVEGFLKMMGAPDTVIGPMNLGNPVETSVAELAQMVIDLTGSRSEITHKPLPIDDPIQRCPDISQAKSLLKWEPRAALKPGLERTIAYFDKLLTERGEITKPASVAA